MYQDRPPVKEWLSTNLRYIYLYILNIPELESTQYKTPTAHRLDPPTITFDSDTATIFYHLFAQRS